MFFACYIVLARTHAVVPAHWLKDYERQMAKYVNLGLNRNQKLLAYYSQKQIDEIESGRSALDLALDYPPNFRLNMGAVFPADGCYEVILYKCFGKRIKYF